MAEPPPDPFAHLQWDAVPDATEAAVAAMLHQVLVNHCVTHDLSFLAALTGVVSLLALCCVALETTGRDRPELLRHTLAALHAAHRASPWRGTLPPFPVLTHPEDGIEDLPQITSPGRTAVQGDALRQALLDLYNEACQEQGVDIHAGWRLMVALVNDVLSMLYHQDYMDTEELDAFIDDSLARAFTNYMAYFLPGPPP